TNTGYVIQCCLSYALQATPEIWRKPEATVMLKKGEECTFSVSLTAYKGISRAEMPRIHSVHPECVLIEEPKATLKSGSLKLKGRAVFAAKGPDPEDR
ncbi:hypothetical protein ACFLQR_05245, partial [Verrucomicrobiota bacterium]